MGPFFNTLRLIALPLAGVTLAAACSQPAGGQARRGGGPAVAIHTTTIQRMAIQRPVDLAGTPNSPDQARVSSEAPGIVRQVLDEIGREVRAGDPLVRLGSQELALALARAESALRQTRAQLGMHGPINTADTPPPDDGWGPVRKRPANREERGPAAKRARHFRAGHPRRSTCRRRTRLNGRAAYQSRHRQRSRTKALLQDRRASSRSSSRRRRRPRAGAGVVPSGWCRSRKYRRAHTRCDDRQVDR